MQVDFHRTKIRLQTPRKTTKKVFPEGLTKKQSRKEDGRDHENQQIHRREEASAWETTSHSGCEVQVPYSQRLAPPNHIRIYERF